MNRKQVISVIFLGLLCFSLILPSLHATTTRKDALISYIKNCKTASGYGNTPGAAEPTLEATFQAIFILKVCGELGDVDADSLTNWVNSCRNADFGYGNTPDSLSEIYSTYYACWILNNFNEKIETHTYEWVADCQNESGGFGNKPNMSENVYATYFGIETLIINGTDLTNNSLSTWLIGRQNTNDSSEGYGGFATDGTSSNMWATWAAMGSIARLKSINNITVEPLVSWLNSSQNLNIYEEDYGAFSSKPEESDYSVLSTYTAIYSLIQLGTTYLSRINLNSVLNWLLNLQNEDGGFRLNSFDAASSLSASYYVFSILNLLGKRSLLDNDVPWEAGFQLPLWAWILIGIAIAILVILAIKKKFYS